MQKQSARIQWMDGVRVIACLMVILMHAPMPSTTASNAFNAFYSYLNVPCIPLFFMLSGALLFPIKGSSRQFLTKRVSKLVIPAVFWSSLVLIFRFYKGQVATSEHILKAFFKMPFGPVEEVYWYLYTAIGLYLFAPILSVWLANTSRRMIEGYLLLWSVTLFLPYLDSFFPGIFNINPYTTLFAFTGFTGYMILGYYLAHFEFHFKAWYKHYPLRSGMVILTIILIIGVPPFVYLIKRVFGHQLLLKYDFYLVSHAMLMSVIVFLLIKYWYHCFPIIHKLCAFLAPLTFGIYLVHFIIQRDYVWHWMETYFPNMHSGVAPLFISMITLLISTIVVLGIKRLSFSKYIIGV
ncbi:MAG: acyltransferase [Odoribacter sp.]